MYSGGGILVSCTREMVSSIPIECISSLTSLKAVVSQLLAAQAKTGTIGILRVLFSSEGGHTRRAFSHCS